MRHISKEEYDFMYPIAVEILKAYETLRDCLIITNETKSEIEAKIYRRYHRYLLPYEECNTPKNS